MKTYYAARDIAIQSRAFAAGEAIGTGDVGKGQFTPAKGAEPYVSLSHVQARLADGRITDKKPVEKKGE